MTEHTLILHHISIEIMGKEFAPQGFMQHFALIVATSLVAFFTLYGFVTFVKKFLPARSSETRKVRTGESSSPVNS